jgi:hypothetical protein
MRAGRCAKPGRSAEIAAPRVSETANSNRPRASVIVYSGSASGRVSFTRAPVRLNQWPGDYRITYYPRALDLASARPIELAAGQQERADMEGDHLPLALRLPAAR